MRTNSKTERQATEERDHHARTYACYLQGYYQELQAHPERYEREFRFAEELLTDLQSLIGTDGKKKVEDLAA